MPKITYTGDATKAERAAKQVEDSLTNLNRRSEQTGKFFRQIEQEGASAFGTDMIRRITGVTSAMAGALAIARAITAEYRAQVAQAERLGGAATGLAGAEAGFILNVATADERTRTALRQQTRQLAALGVDRATAFQGVGETFSATGGNLAATLGATTLAARTTGAPEQFLAMAPGLADIITATGFNDLQALGLLETFQAQTRIGTIVESSRAVGRVAMRGRQLGGRGIGAPAILAGLTAGGMDPRGERSTTAATQMLERLMEYSQTQGIEAASPMEALQAIIAGGLGRDFMGSFAWGSESRGAIEDVATGGIGYERAMAVYRGAQTPEQRRAVGRAAIAQMDTRIQRHGRFERTLGAAVQDLALARDQIPLSAEAKESLRVLATEIYGTAAQANAAILFQGAAVTQPEAMGIIESMRGMLEQRMETDRPSFPTTFGNVPTAGPTPQPSEQQTKQLQLLETISNSLESRNATRGNE